MRKPIIYFAGKIGHGDWRTEIFSDTRIGGLAYNDEAERNLFNPDYKENKGSFFYGGPFSVSCDHRCSHAGNLHGAAQGCGFASKLTLTERRRQIWQVNHERLKGADLIFTYINETDCYGTLVELGMAQTRNKRIVVGFGTDLAHAAFDDLWMARQTASEVYRGTPQQVWRDFKAEVLNNFWNRHEHWQRNRMDEEFAELEAAE